MWNWFSSFRKHLSAMFSFTHTRAMYNMIACSHGRVPKMHRAPQCRSLRHHQQVESTKNLLYLLQSEWIFGNLFIGMVDAFADEIHNVSSFHLCNFCFRWCSDWLIDVGYPTTLGLTGKGCELDFLFWRSPAVCALEFTYISVILIAFNTLFPLMLYAVPRLLVSLSSI